MKVCGCLNVLRVFIIDILSIRKYNTLALTSHELYNIYAMNYQLVPLLNSRIFNIDHKLVNNSGLSVDFFFFTSKYVKIYCL